jgi:hypothetical protein
MLASGPTRAALSNRATNLPRSRISITATTTATVGRVVFASNATLLTVRRGWRRQLPRMELPRHDERPGRELPLLRQR